jgi:limonene-1,2-epoxide hydrolase
MRTASRLLKSFGLCIVFMSMNPVRASDQPSQVQKTVEFFMGLNKDNIALVDQFYDKDAEFQDPVVDLHGAAALREYYRGLYKNVKSIHFEFTDQVVQGNELVVVWKMTLAADGLNGGKEFTVPGNSFIRFGGTEGKVIYHRDYFDMGDFIYERLIKSKFAHSS